MCRTCGCSARDGAHRHDHGDTPGRVHARARAGVQEQAHPPGGPPRALRFEIDLLAKNDRLAVGTRRWLEDQGILAVNLIGAPGAGKTALLEETARRLGAEITISVLEGDQATDHDAARVRAVGCPVLQINTGAGCHLDASMIKEALPKLAPPRGSLLFVENVGNLVCPALFDLGERAKVVVMSVTEGEDKPLKYPHVFRASEAVVLTKIDLLPHLDVDVERCLANVRRANPGLRVFPLSATTGEGVGDWCEWLRAQAEGASASS